MTGKCPTSSREQRNRTHMLLRRGSQIPTRKHGGLNGRVGAEHARVQKFRERGARIAEVGVMRLLGCVMNGMGITPPEPAFDGGTKCASLWKRIQRHNRISVDNRDESARLPTVRATFNRRGNEVP